MTDTNNYTLGELAEHLGAQLEGDASTEIIGLHTLSSAKAGQLSFLANPNYQRFLEETEAAAVILHPDMAPLFSGPKLLVNDPYLAYAKLSKLFDGQRDLVAGIHPTAVVDDSAQLGLGVSIGPNACIGQGVCLGDGVMIGANSSVGANTVIGARSRLYANVSVYHGVIIGDEVTLHSGSVIGADGFGNAHELVDGQFRWVKIHQLGGVRIGNCVEVGAATTIDRGALDDTIIEDGVIIDNHVMIAHNVKVGRNTAMAGKSSIAGSTEVGAHCIIAGGVGIAGHLKIADGTKFTAMTLVTKSITEADSYSSGTGMQRTKLWRKNAVRFGQLDKVVGRLSLLEKAMAKLLPKGE